LGDRRANLYLLQFRPLVAIFLLQILSQVMTAFTRLPLPAWSFPCASDGAGALVCDSQGGRCKFCGHVSVSEPSDRGVDLAVIMSEFAPILAWNKTRTAIVGLVPWGIRTVRQRCAGRQKIWPRLKSANYSRSAACGARFARLAAIPRLQGLTRFHYHFTSTLLWPKDFTHWSLLA